MDRWGRPLVPTTRVGRAFGEGRREGRAGGEIWSLSAFGRAFSEARSEYGRSGRGAPKGRRDPRAGPYPGCEESRRNVVAVSDQSHTKVPRPILAPHVAL